MLLLVGLLYINSSLWKVTGFVRDAFTCCCGAVAAASDLLLRLLVLALPSSPAAVNVDVDVRR